MHLRFNWNSAINIDPFDSNTIYFGSQFVHKSTDKGLTWEVISPDLTTNDPEKQKQSESGGLSMDATGAENHTTILVIEPSSLEKNMFWVGSDDGRVHYTQNGGQSYTEVTKNLKGLPSGSWIVQIKASNKNKGEALLIANDYRRFNYTPYAYRTTNYGKSWTRIVDSNDVQSYTLSIVEDPEEKNLLFLGTDDGLYVSVDAGSNWTKWTKGFPTTSVKDLVIHPREHDLVIGTFGRAAWVLDDIRPLRAIARDRSTLSRKLNLFQPPTAYDAAYQQPTGSRFGGDALFNGENRDGGAQIRYYLTKVKTPKKGKKGDADSEEDKNTPKWDSIHLKIYDGTRQIRHLKTNAPDSTGIHTMTWRLNEAGGDRPARRIRKRTNEPGGVTVKPGTYKLVMSYGDQTSEQSITVASDPRLDISQKAINEIYERGKLLQKYTQTAADAVKQLVESKDIAKSYEKDLKEKDKEGNKEAIKAAKEIGKEIDTVIALYLGKEDKRQGITRNPAPTVMRRIGTASQYSSSRPEGMTATEDRLLQHAKEELEEAIEKTNTFFAEKWTPFETKMKALDVLPFKEIKTIKLD